MKKKISIIIPARLKSLRFNNKILQKINGLPMIEHVRKRALLSKLTSEVIVATPDKKIYDIINSNNGNVIYTNKSHTNGTDRVSEAIKYIDCTHVVILQGDEPLILPEDLDKFINYINKTRSNYFNCVGVIKNKKEIDDLAVVKSIINKNGYITNCFRSNNKLQLQNNIYKLFGIIGFEKKSLIKLNKLKTSHNEMKLQIEQMKLIDNKLPLRSLIIKGTTTSVNYKKDLNIVKNEFRKNNKQKKILKKYL